MRRKELQPIRAGRHRSKFSLRKKQSATDPVPKSCGQYGSAANTALNSDAKSIENVVALLLVHCWVRGRTGWHEIPTVFPLYPLCSLWLSLFPVVARETESHHGWCASQSVACTAGPR